MAKTTNGVNLNVRIPEKLKKKFIAVGEKKRWNIRVSTEEALELFIEKYGKKDGRNE
jgi:hypothetical protein